MKKQTKQTNRKTYGAPGLQIRVLPDNSSRFLYYTAYGGFTFSLLCEVGQPWQTAFAALMKKHGVQIAKKPMDLPASPWLADTLEQV